MLLSYVPLTDTKEGRYITGLPMSKFMAFVKDKTIDTSKRNGDKLFVNNLSLASFTKRYGGRKERLREFILDNIRQQQYKYISLILKNNDTFTVEHNYTNQQIKQWHKVYTEYHKNETAKETLNSIGYTEELLSENYGTDAIDVGFHKLKESEYFYHESNKIYVAEPKTNKFRYFFNTYLQTKKDYETNFNFYVSYGVLKSIIKKSRKDFK